MYHTRNKEVRDAMKAAGLTQFLLGELIGKSESAVFRMLRKELTETEKTEYFIEYINLCRDSRNIYEKYIKKLAVELNLKTQEQFINDSFAAANYKIPFGDLLNIIDCKDKFFDSEIDSDGDDGKC